MFVKKSLKIPGDDDVSPIGLKPISQSVRYHNNQKEQIKIYVLFKVFEINANLCTENYVPISLVRGNMCDLEHP